MNAIGLQKPTGEYSTFNSVKFHDPAFPESESDAKTCKQRCDGDDNCGSWSYNGVNGLCYLGSDAVFYNPEYAYYEKNAEASDASESTEAAEQPKPEKVATPEQEKKMEEPHLQLPDDSALEARLQATKERVEAVDKKLANPPPELDLNVKRERKRKRQIMLEDSQRKQNAAGLRAGEETLFDLQSQAQQYKNTIREEEASEPDQLRSIAKAAFADGFESSATRGTAAFRMEKQKLLDERAEAAGSGGKAEDFATILQKRNKEKAAKAASLAKSKHNNRQKEIADKSKKHAQALALSRMATKLIASEAGSKSTAAAINERQEKDNRSKINNELSRKATWITKSKVNTMMNSEKQEKKMEFFRLTQAKDKNVELQQQIELKKQLAKELLGKKIAAKTAGSN